MTTSATITSSGPISAVETVVTAPFAITPAAGQAYRVTLVGTVSSDLECSPTFNLRMGTTGTVTDALVTSISPVVDNFTSKNAVLGGYVTANEAFEIEFIATIQTLSATGLVDGFANVQGNGNGGFIGITEVNPAPATINTSAATALEVSVVGSLQIVDNAAMTLGSANISLTGTGSTAGAPETLAM